MIRRTFGLAGAGALMLIAGAPLATLAQDMADHTNYHIVPGERHGASFFPFAQHSEVEYHAGETLTFDHYHTADVMFEWMHRWAEMYPEIVDVYEVGQSFGGTSILQMTITNKSTGADTDKPAAFFEGGRHSGEITASESVLWLMQHLLESYGSDPEITHLIDTRTIYLRPQNNPDGGSMYLKTAQANRSTVRPIDNDGDGLLDEDPADDLDGDGIIYQMRWRPRPGTDDQATHIMDPDDPTGHLMRPARDGEEAIWVVQSEGIDNDGDGLINEDGIGGLDLHRNYPENWRPDSGGDATGRGYTQFGAGEYPLSEPETRSVVLWVLSHPNIAVANSMDTRVPMHLRPPSTSRGEERMYPEDLALYEYFDELGLSITNYPWAGDVYETYATRYGTNQDGSPQLPSPLFGHGPDFGYFYLGTIWYGDELWNNGAHEDENGDGRLDNYDAIIWDERDNNGEGFRDWEPVTVPFYGEVEMGGFHPKFFSQNGPPAFLEEWARKQALFNLQLALHLPELEMRGVNVRSAGTDDEGRLFDIDVSWENVGQLPTALRQAQLVKIVREDNAYLELDAADGVQVEILDPEWRDKRQYADRTLPGETKTVTFRVRVTGNGAVTGTAHVSSTRGGVLAEAFTLPGG